MKSLLTLYRLPLLLLALPVLASEPLEPTPFPALDYDAEILAGPHDPAFPTPEALLGFPIGQRAATPEQIVVAAQSWAEASPRARFVEYARSHRGRPLFTVILSSPENLARLDDIQAGVQRLADPEGLSDAEAEAIIEGLPGIAWMSYSIHGDESSGADAALAAIYHLVASTDPAVVGLLGDLVVFIDPMQNPDGRARFTDSLSEARGAAPNVDSQAVLHYGTWPSGRGNHYHFDLNRDFFFLVHPETRGRVAMINQWFPQIHIDGHEMGALDTYLFGPPREPVNRHLPGPLRAWETRFAEDQAAAFDRQAWTYYTGEWADALYPGYSNYSMFRGSMQILYEQAGYAEDGVRQANGNVETYRAGVHRQLVSTLANLESLQRYSKDMYREFVADRRAAISGSGPYANRSWAVLPTANATRLGAFADRLVAQDIRFFMLKEAMTVRQSVSMDGVTVAARELPPGTLIIPNRQPEARLLATMMEFDAEISDEALLAERRELLRYGWGTMYDITAWNLGMMFGLEVVQVPTYLGRGLTPWQAPATRPPLAGADAPLAWVVDGEDDASVGFAARMLEQGAVVRVVDRATRLGGHDMPRGSVFVGMDDNRDQRDRLPGLVESTARDMGVTAHGIDAGLGAGDLPDIGGDHFRLLEAPRIAVLSRGQTSPTSFGATWHAIDSQLGIRHTHLDENDLRRQDLRRYNVIVLPDRYADLPESTVEALGSWVEAGGTLVSIGDAAEALIEPETGISSVRAIEDSFGEAARYDLSLQREWLARQPGFGRREDLASHTVPMTVTYPVEAAEPEPDEESLKKRDDWQKIFMPQGAFLAGSVDQKHWLSFGAGERLPVLFGGSTVLMSDDRSRAVVRLGVLRDGGESEEATRLGWATIPPEQEIQLRMSGLLWPEAAQRLANTAYLTRESRGYGQIILFADNPVFRGATFGTARLLLNALVYGPGLGADQPIRP
jgi:hypothetical protein